MITNRNITVLAVVLLGLAVLASAYGAPGNGWEWPEARQQDSAAAGIGRTAQTADTPRWPARQAAADPAEARARALEEWLENIDHRVAHQGHLIDWTLTWRLGLIVALISVCAVSITYLWIRVGRLWAAVDALVSRHTDGAGLTERPKAVAAPHGYSSPLAGGVVRDSIPRVRFLYGVIDRLVAGINESRRRRGDVETGYALVGRITGDGPSRVITVCGLIDEGPNAARSGGHHKADRSYQQDELCLLQLTNPDLMHIGDAHLHPGSMDTCSAGDHRTDTGNVRASRSQEMVFVIATAVSAHWRGRFDNSLRHAGLKLDFYYLGKASGYEYRRFRPEIVQGDALSASEPLRRFIEADPVRGRLDFDNLRRLADYRMTVSDLPGEDGIARACIEMTHKTRNFRTLITFTGDPRMRPEVLVDTGDQMAQFQPAHLNGGSNAMVWFTPIVLEVEREITVRRVAGNGKNTSTPASGRSAHAGMEVPGPKIGDSHGKLHITEQEAGGGDPQGDGPVPVRCGRPGIPADHRRVPGDRAGEFGSR